MNEENKEYYIERLNAHRLKDIETLHEIVYGESPKKNYFQKKYDTAYLGVQYICHIAYNLKNIPVACFGVIPCFIQFNTKKNLSAQAVDAITLPHYRYKGIFLDLVNRTVDLCRSHGISLIFGFPNQNSFHGLVHS